MSVRALIFDFDGLILDTESTEYEAIREVFAAHGCDLSFALWADVIGRPRGYFDFYAHLEQVSGAVIDRELVRSRRRARVRELNLSQPLRPGVLDYLRQGREMSLKMGVASSSDRSWVCGHLDRLGLLEQFDAVKCFEDTGSHKPDPAPYRAVLDALEVAPGEAVAFEDSPNGVASAKAAGLFCVAVPNPVTRRLCLDQADICIESLAALPLEKLLLQLSGSDGSRA
jgi:HAD superfamily hydrolase (TIGR01509 family)